MTISMPPGMEKTLEKIRKVENRTRSEMVREAFRLYINNFYPEVGMTKREEKIFREGRKEFALGEFVTLNELKNELARSRREKKSKKSA
jgi:predicted transcriptional regulator